MAMKVKKKRGLKFKIVFPFVRNKDKRFDVFFLKLIFSPEICPKPRGHVIATRITSENPDEVRT